MPKHRIISADSHATIGQEYLLDALPMKYQQTVRDAAPSRSLGGMTESDMQAMAQAQRTQQGGDRPSGRAGAGDPVERIKDMDIDGVEAEVLHCVVAGAHVGVSGDTAMRAAFMHAENEARQAWCATDPQRLIPVAVLPLENIDDAVKELQWLGREGFRAVEIPVYPDEVGLKPYGHESWAPLWNVASELEYRCTCTWARTTACSALLATTPHPAARSPNLCRRSTWRSASHPGFCQAPLTGTRA